VRAGAALVLLLLVTACGGDGDESGERAGDRLPPATLAAIAPQFADDLRPLGVRLTRAALIDVGDGQYTRSSAGTHLALYVEPTGAYTGTDYVDGLFTVTDVFAPEVFERWSGLESFDVCQEPPESGDSRREPDPITQVNLTRAQAEAIDWDDDEAGTATLLAASADQPRGDEIVTRIDRSLTVQPAYREALADAAKL
jgi:hypothetical protein